MSDEKKKGCTKCGEEKPATTKFFYKSKLHAYGVRPDCKECTKRYRNNDTQRTYYRRNTDACKEMVRTYAKQNPEALRKRQKAFWIKSRAILGDAYVKKIISERHGIPYCDITAKEIELKRKSLKAHRLITKIKKKYENNIQTTEKNITGLRRRA